MIGPLTRIVYFGTADFAVPPLRALLDEPESYEVVAVVSQPDRPAGRKGELRPSPVSQTAREAGLPLLQPAKLDERAVEDLQALRADLFVVAAYGQILSQAVLNLPSRGTLNLHGSLLPKYRGASPIQSVLRDGESETGVTLMLMDRKMDHGPVLAEIREQIDARDDYPSLSGRLAEAAASLLTTSLPEFLDGKLEPTEQNHSAATFTKILEKEDGRIDWNKDSGWEIERRVRAFRPWPGVFFDWPQGDGKTVRIKLLTATVEHASDRSPGEAFLTEDGLPAITASDREAVRLIEVQPAGRKPMSGADFARGFLKTCHSREGGNPRS